MKKLFAKQRSYATGPIESLDAKGLNSLVLKMDSIFIPAHPSDAFLTTLNVHCRPRRMQDYRSNR